MQAKVIVATLSVLLFVSAVERVESFKFRKTGHVQISSSQAVPPPPPPPPQPAPPVVEQQELIEDTRFLSPFIYGPAPVLPSYQPLPPPPPAAEYIRHDESPRAGTKGGAVVVETTERAPQVQPQPNYVQGHHTVAYLVVKPFSKFQNYYDPSLAAYHQQRAFAPAAFAQPPALRPLQYPQEAYPVRQNLDSTKGGRQQQQQVEQQIEEQQQQIIEQHDEAAQQHPAPAPPAPGPQQPPQAIVVPIHAAKESKLKAMIDKIMAKFALGSSYHVVSEEFVNQAPLQPQQPPLQQQQQIEQQQELQEDQRFLKQQIKEQQQQQQISLEQQLDTTNGFGEEKSAPRSPAQELIEQPQQQQQQQQREEQFQQQQQAPIKQEEQNSFAPIEQLDLARQPQQQPSGKTASQLPRQPANEQLQLDASKSGKGRFAESQRFAGQQQLAVIQESQRQELAKGF